MTIGKLLERCYAKKIGVYTPTEEDDVFIDIYKGVKEEIPEAVNSLEFSHWGITKGYVDICVRLQNEEDIQDLINALANEEIRLWQKCKAKQGNNTDEVRLKIVRKVLKNFAKSINATLPNQKCAKMTEKESEGKT